MTDQDWVQLKALFAEATDKPATERAAFIEQATIGQPALRRHLQDLVRNHERSDLSDGYVSFQIPPVFADGQIVAERFRIVRFIERGGMGEVYEAWDERLRQRIAVKTIRPDWASDGVALERFRREVRLAREVSHENLCRVFDLVEHRDDGQSEVVPVLTMQYLLGESLKDHLVRHRPLALDDALHITQQVAAAIDALHRAGIVHRDLKPGNIMLHRAEGSAWHATVTDFGLAKLFARDDSLFQSSADAAAGAPYFMAPEQLRDQKSTPASDIYALGLVLDEMVTTRRAFDGQSREALFFQRLHEQPIPPSARSADLPVHWETTILRCLELGPSARFVTGAAVVDALQQRALPAPAVNESVAPPRPAPLFDSTSAPQSKRRILRAALIAAAVVLLGFVWLAQSLARPLGAAVALYPIENLTSDPAVNYFSEGITSEIMRRLLQTHLLRDNNIRLVPMHEPRGSGTGRDGISFEISGHIQGTAKAIRLTVELFDRANSRVIWLENFDRELTNPIAVEDEISKGAVETIETRLIAGGAGPMQGARSRLLPPLRRWITGDTPDYGAAPTSSGIALDYYMRGRALVQEGTRAKIEEANQLYRQAIAADAQFGLAYAALADAQLALRSFTAQPDEVYDSNARRFAEKGIELSPQFAETQLSFAATRQSLGDWDGARKAFQRAIELSPNSARAHRWYADLLLHQPETVNQALSEARLSLELDPYDLPAYATVAMYLDYAGRHQEAADLLHNAVSRKDLGYFHNNLGYTAIYMAQSSSSETEKRKYLQIARDEAERVRTFEIAERHDESFGTPNSDCLLALAAALGGDQTQALRILDRMRVDQAQGHAATSDVASVYAALGDRDHAFIELDRAAREHESALQYLKVSPLWANLRADPRYNSLLKLLRL
jgi:eukaryotic-like serine/threonine-protein kinase